MKITFDVKNQILTRTDRSQVIANSSDYLEAEVTFSADWATMEKTMQFKNGDYIISVVLANNKILQENHLNLGVGTWKVSIIGVAGDQKIVTNECNLSVNASGWIGSKAIPPESVWNQLLVTIQSLHTEAASSAVIRSAVQKYIEDNYDMLVKEAVILDDGTIQEVLNEMADDGVLTSLLTPLVREEVATAAAEEVGDWLEDNVDPDTGYVIDASLTTALAAADAKATGDKITDLRNNLTDATGVTEIPWTENAYIATNVDPIDFTPTSNNNYAYILTDCAEGDVYTLTARGTSSTARIYCFCKDDGTVVERPTMNLNWTEHKITTPAGATKLICNTGKSYPHKLYKGVLLDDEIKEVVNTMMGSRNIASYTPHIPAYYPVIGATFDLSTLPVDTFVYDDYSKFADNFIGTEIEDLGISSTANVRIEKRSLNNNSGIYYFLFQVKTPKITAIIWSTGKTEVFVNRTYLDSKLEGIINMIGSDDKTTKINDALSIINNSFIYESPLLLQDGESIIESSTIYDFTDYIKCDKYIGFEIKGVSTRIVAYFYTYNNGSYELTWDVMDYTTSDNKKNYFGLNAYNKVLSIPNPDNTYVRFAVAVGKPKDVSVYLWSGEHIGCNIGGSWRHAETDDDDIVVTRSTENINVLGSYIPNTAQILFCKNILIRDVFGFKSVNGNRVGAEILSKAYLQVYSLPLDYDYFMVNFILAEENYRDSTAHAATNAATGGFLLNDYVSSVGGFDTYDTTFGKAANLIEPIQTICTIPWKCKNQTSIYNSGTFYLNKNYMGVPYASIWTTASYFGWHITRHTFINAANDNQSKFYKETGRNGRGTGYSLVCSAFTSLVTGCPYPVTTNGLLDDPQMQHEYTLQPKVGTIMYKGSEHSLLMLELSGGVGYKSYALAEGINPTSAYRINYDFMLDVDNVDNAYNWHYIEPYVYSCMHREATGAPQAYNITDGVIVNGSARPYRGDQSVYTSAMDVRINIKNNAAETLYYQKCTYSDGVFTLTGSPLSVIIDGATYINLDKETLDDESFYAVWTDADNVKEYFEYHVAPTVTYSVSNGNITFSTNDFWYALWWQGNTENGKTAIVPKLADGNYSEYVEAYSISGNVDGYMFFKGTLGAYVVPLNHTT